MYRLRCINDVDNVLAAQCPEKEVAALQHTTSLVRDQLSYGHSESAIWIAQSYLTK